MPYKNNKISIWILFIILIFLTAGLTKLQLNASYKAYFDPESPLLKQLDNIEQRYESNDNILVVLSRKSGSILEQDSLGVIDKIVEQAWQLPNVERVASILDLPLLNSEEEPDGFFDKEVTEDIQIPSQETLSSHPRVSGLLLSEDSKTTAVYIVFNFAGNAGETEVNIAKETLSSAQSVKNIIKDLPVAMSKNMPEDIKIHLTGTVMLSDNYINVVRHDLRFFIPALLFIFFIALWLFFKSKRIAIATLLSAFAAVFSAFGTAGWLGFEMASIHTFAPVMIISISVAISVHLISTFLRERNNALNNQQAIEQSVTLNRLAIRLTTLTTFTGFLALLLSPSPPVRAMGFIVAIGSLAAYFINFYIFTKFISNLPDKYSKPRSIFFQEKLVERMVNWMTRFNKYITACLALITVLALVGVAQARIDDNVIEYFPKEDTFRVATQEANKKLSGVTIVDYSIATQKSNGIFSEEYLNTLKQFKNWLLTQSAVKHVSAITDWSESLNKSGSSPFSQEEVDQLLLSLNDRTPEELGVRNEVSEDYSATRVRVYLTNSDNSVMIDLDKKSREWLTNNASEYVVSGGAGPALVFAHIGEQNIAGMLQALAIALLMTMILVGITTRSKHTILACALCNLLPVLWVLSLWALMDGRLSLGVTVVIGMILGIIVDDSIHLITKYHKFHNQSGNPHEAIIKTFIAVGPALVITTVTLILGLSVGLLSDFRPVVVMSQLSISIIFVALIVDFFLLPLLLVSNRHVSLTKNAEISHGRI